MTVDHHETIDGIEFIEIENPDGSGCSYYAEAGPEGNMFVINMGDFPPTTLLKLVAWSLRKKKVKPKTPVDPKPKFNTAGWSF